MIERLSLDGRRLLLEDEQWWFVCRLLNYFENFLNGSSTENNHAQERPRLSPCVANPIRRNLFTTTLLDIIA